MGPGWALTLSSFQVPCIAWRRICTRRLFPPRAQARADQVSAVEVEAEADFQAGASAAAAEARSEDCGILFSSPELTSAAKTRLTARLNVVPFPVWWICGL